MLKYKFGNIFETKCNVIGHGVNCRGVFGAGIALQMRRKYPQVYDAYANKHASSGWMPGDIQIVKLPYGVDKYIVNMATQYDYGRNATFASLTYIEDCLDKILVFCSENNLNLAIPYIGAGLGGLTKDAVKNTVKKVCEKHVVYVELWSFN